MKSKQSYILNRGITTMLIAVMLLFIAAVFGHMNTYAAAGDVVNGWQGNYRGMDWKIVEGATSGEKILKLGSLTENQIYRNNGPFLWDDFENWKALESEGYSRDRYEAAIRDAIPWLEHTAEITSVEVIGSVKIQGAMSFWFSGMGNCMAIEGLNNIDTSEATSLNHLFTSYYYEGDVRKKHASPQVTSLNVSSWNTSNVRYFANLFNGLAKLESIDVSNFDTSNAKSIHSMFVGCASLKKINLSNFDTSDVIDMAYMFNGCKAVEEIDLTGFDTKNVGSLVGMFNDCFELETLKGYEQFDTSNVKNMSYTFRECKKLKTLDLSGWDTSSVTTMNRMFSACYGLEEIKGLDGFDTSNVTDMTRMFYGNSKLGNIDMLDFDMSNVTEAAEMLILCDGAITKKLDEMSNDDKYTPETKAKIADAKAKFEALTKPGTTTEQVRGAISIIKGEMEAADKEDAAIDAKKAYEEAKKEYDKEYTKDPSSAATAQAAKNLEDAGQDYLNKAKDAYGENSTQAKEAAARTTEDAAVIAINKAKEAVDNANKLKAEADKLAAEKPGSDEAIAAAVKAAAAAAEAQKLAAAAADAAKATGNDELVNQAAAVSGNADTARADANKLVTEQKQKKADELIAKDPKSPEAQAAQNEATEAAKQELAENQAMFGANSPQAQDAQNRVNIAQQAQQKIDVAVQQDAIKVGDVYEVGGSSYEVTMVATDSATGEVALKTAKNAKNYTVAKTVALKDGKTYEVNRIKAGAFKGKKTTKVTLTANVEKLDAKAFQKSKVKTIVVKTKYLTKKSVKGSLKGSKVKTIQVKTSSKKKMVKKYKNIFTKKNAGKKVTVK